jgi:hypothetical protein
LLLSLISPQAKIAAAFLLPGAVPLLEKALASIKWSSEAVSEAMYLKQQPQVVKEAAAQPGCTAAD